VQARQPILCFGFVHAQDEVAAWSEQIVVFHVLHRKRHKAVVFRDALHAVYR
jgi:hypothetical protein